MAHPARKKVRISCGNHTLTNVADGAVAPTCRGRRGSLLAGLTQEGRASLPAPKLAMRSILDVEHGNDLERARIHHDDLIVDEEHLVTAPVRVDVDDFHRKRVERDLARNAGTDRDREIDVGRRPD